MSLLFEKGTWTGSGSSPETITLVDGNLTPQAIMCWTTGPGTAGSFVADAIFSHGFSTYRGGSVQSGCVGIISIDNVATGDTARVRSSTTLLHVLSSTSATDYTVSLSSFSAGQFVVTYSSSANASGDIFHYVVWGGSDVTDAIVINKIMATQAGGSQTITGTGFRPNVLLALDSDLATSDTVTDGVSYGFGMATSATQARSFAIAATDGDAATSTMRWNSATRSAECVQRVTLGADTVDARWGLTSFDVDGATLSIVDPPSSTDRIDTFLFIQGGSWEVGSKAKATTTGSDTYSLSNTTLTPKGIVLHNARKISDGLTNARIDVCIGAGDGVREGIAGITCPEAINTTCDRIHATNRAMDELTGGTSPAKTSEATSLTTGFSQGAFNLNWTVNGGSLAFITYLACGDNASPSVGSRNRQRMTRGLGR